MYVCMCLNIGEFYYADLLLFSWQVNFNCRQSKYYLYTHTETSAAM